MFASGQVVSTGQFDSWESVMVSETSHYARPPGALPWLPVESPRVFKSYCLAFPQDQLNRNSQKWRQDPGIFENSLVDAD